MALAVTPPSDLTDVIQLADWVELLAIVADDRNSSKGDLDQLLRRAGMFEGGARPIDEAIEAHSLSVFSVLEHRAKLLGEFYPFKITAGVVACSPPFTEKLLPYVFCLCLAYLGEIHSTKRLKPRLMFEELSAFAASAYLGGDQFLFGTSRSRDGDQTKRFKDAVTSLCHFVGEGSAFRSQPGLAKKDDHVDVVIVKHFMDRGTSKLVLFGQCASGVHWPSKISELQPTKFWDHWMEQSRVSEILRSFFVPFSIDPKKWDYHARYAGLLFDRLRIAYWASQSQHMAINSARFSAWINGCLKI
jgi:hypothetical protein